VRLASAYDLERWATDDLPAVPTPHLIARLEADAAAEARGPQDRADDLIDPRPPVCPLMIAIDSDHHNDPAERARIDQVTQCVCSIFKRECLGDDGLDLSRTEKLGNRLPRLGPCR
jgi:hypothetical protein